MKYLLISMLLLGVNSGCVATKEAGVRRMAESHLEFCLRSAPMGQDYRQMCYNETTDYCTSHNLEKGCGFGGTNQWMPRER